MLKNAVSICGAQFGNLFLIDNDGAHWEAGVGTPPKLAEYFTQSRSFRPTPGSHLDRVMRTKQVSHTADDAAEVVIGAAARLGGARSTVCVPMVKDEALVGAIFIYRTEVRPFTDKQIDLVKNFAAQAVIALSTRLLNELRQRTDDLSRVAAADCGGRRPKTISRSALTFMPCYARRSAARLSSRYGAIFLRDGELYRSVAHNGFSQYQKYAAEHRSSMIEGTCGTDCAGAATIPDVLLDRVLCTRTKLGGGRAMLGSSAQGRKLYRRDDHDTHDTSAVHGSRKN